VAMGATDDRFVIVAYTIPTSGFYSITNSLMDIKNGKVLAHCSPSSSPHCACKDLIQLL
jgi:hypothetical protein